MKKLTLLLLTFFTVALTASVFGQGKPTTVGVDWKTPLAWNQFANPQVVTIGSSYSYAVELNKTLTLEGLKKRIADPAAVLGADEEYNNRYIWELIKVDVDDTKTPYEYSNEVVTQTDGTFAGLTKNFQPYTWAAAADKTKPYFLIRVSEYPNHGLDATNPTSLTADTESIKISEILVKIGDDAVIVIPEGPVAATLNKDGYLCDAKATTAADFDNLKTFSPTTFLCNALPMVKDPANPTSLDGFSVVLNVTKTSMKATLGGNFTQQLTINVPTANLLNPRRLVIPDPADPTKTKEVDLGAETDGYSALQITLKEISDALEAKKGDKPEYINRVFDFDASDFDIYYEVTVIGYIHKDTDVATSPKTDELVPLPYTVSTPAGISLTNYKVSRVCGVYTQPSITKIQFKK